MTASNGVLHGWKDIAAYFGVSVRTAQRWERDSGLPVRRIQARRGHSAFAVEADLRAWLDAAGPRARAARPAVAPRPAQSVETSSRQPARDDTRRPTFWRVVSRTFRAVSRVALLAFAAR